MQIVKPLAECQFRWAIEIAGGRLPFELTVGIITQQAFAGQHCLIAFLMLLGVACNRQL